jgi:hypothetical protein
LLGALNNLKKLKHIIHRGKTWTQFRCYFALFRRQAVQYPDGYPWSH